jgi:diguanylate cyclase (GGDEF)-like protein
MIAGTICLFVALVVLQTRRSATGSFALIGLLLALAWWDITYAFFWADTPAPARFFWLDITYFGVVTVPVALFVFSLQISRREQWLGSPLMALVYLEPFLVLAALFTDPYHGLFFAGKRLENSAFIQDGGVVFWFNVAFSYSLILLATVLLTGAFLRSSGVYRRQIGVILVGLGITWLNSIIFVAGITPLPGADNTPFSFTVTALAFAYSLFRYRLLDIVPVARDALIENMSDGVIVLDAQNRLVDINPAARRMLSSLKNLEIGDAFDEAFSDLPHLAERFRDVNDTHVELPVGEPPHRYYDLRISPLHGGEGNFIGRLAVWRDITPIKKAQVELQEQVIRDPLTGLFNRRFLTETLEREFARAKRERAPISLVMIDIDQFKAVNDAYGHDAGDAILVGLAKLLQGQTRGGDIVSRYGGEEFLVVLPNVTAEIAFQIAEKWRTSFQSPDTPFETTGIRATISCGIAEYPIHGDTAADVITNADRAMYLAKQMGRNCVMIWEETIQS